jgi:hypothetical protein
LNDIFGFQTGTHKVHGLVDAKSEAEYEESLKDLKDSWCLREKNGRQIDLPQFYDWFVKHHANTSNRRCCYPYVRL